VRSLAGSLLGVPAAMLLAAGLGIVAVTLVSRARGRRARPIRWAHLVLGLGMAAAGVLLLYTDVALIGVS
jgi:hypothetical protein